MDTEREKPLQDETPGIADSPAAQEVTAPADAPSGPDSSQNSSLPDGETEPSDNQGKKKKRHWIKITWLRRTLKTLFGFIIFLIIFPFLLYIPPVQDGAVWLAEKIVKNATGMDVSIGYFRLKFPLDVSLRELSVVQSNGDTLLSAREAVADVKILPLLKLDVKVNKLQLNDAYYKIVSEDSSMLMTIRAGFMEVDDKSEMKIAKSDINLNKAKIRDADIRLYMDVWKQKPQPEDTTTPMRIAINDLDGERIRFGMSLLPVFDTLSVYAEHLYMRNGVIDLRENKITADELKADDGAVTYIFPTPEYVETHPAPVDTVYSPPMEIMGKKVIFDNFDVFYGMKGAKPLPGFDVDYMHFRNTNIVVDNFYDAGPTLRIPVKSISGKERSGLDITGGHGYVGIDSTGVYLDSVYLQTPRTHFTVTADVPFELMDLKPEAPLNVSFKGSLAREDLHYYDPSLDDILKFLPDKTPLDVDIKTSGTLSDIDIRRLDVSLPEILTLRASGTVENPFDMKKLVADVKLDGEVYRPSYIEEFTGKLDFKIPVLKIKGEIGADRENYRADISLLTPQGDLAARGDVSMNAESYDAHLKITDLNAGYFMPGTGLGKITATVDAKGKGFDPLSPGANTDISLKIASIAYKGSRLRDIALRASLKNDNYSLELTSPNRDADIDLNLAGRIAGGTYSAKGYLKANRIDLRALGLDTAMNGGAFDIVLDATVNPDKWLYDVDLAVNNLDWSLPGDTIHLPEGINARLLATENDVRLNLDCQQTSLAFESPENLKKIVDQIGKASAVAMKQIAVRELNFEDLQQNLPKFTLRLNTPCEGLVDDFLKDSGFRFGRLDLSLGNDSTITGNAYLTGLQTETMELDTITLSLSQRNYLLDYKLHLGNRAGNLDEFHDVNLNGYVGGNRLSAYLNQRNLEGETGYKLGFTGALADSTLSIHFTPLNSMIGYHPWTLNADNYVDINLENYKIEANLEAKSNDSSVLLETRPGADDLQELNLQLTNIRIQDFIQTSATTPPFTATVNANVRARYDGKELVGTGRIGLSDLSYDNTKIDDLNLMLQAAMDMDGTYDVSASLAVERRKALILSTKLVSEEEGLSPEFVKLTLDNFPLSVANALLGKDVAQLQGTLSGEMDLSGGLKAPLLNGSIRCDSVAVYLPIMGSSLKFDNEPLVVTDNVVRFNNFDIWGANSNPLTIDGTIDARKFNDIQLDISANAQNFALINNDRRARSDLYGKLFLNFNATARGAMTHFLLDANLNILGNTDVFYTLADANTAIQSQTDSDVVTFVNLSDTTQVFKPEKENVYMRVNATVSITPGAMVTVNLSNNGTDRVQLSPSGSVSLYRNYLGDITLNGQLFTGNGFARYNIPVIGDKEFVFDPSSSIVWNGPMMNPNLNLHATNTMKVSVSQNGGNSRLINFLIGLNVGGTLDTPSLLFNLSTDDDITIENQLQGMSAEQRNSVAMNLFVTGMYSVGDVSSSSGPLVGNVYSFLTQQLNSWAAKNIRGVDLSFGVNQYNMTTDGQTSTATSYSYQLSKSLFNNRFKISVGGNYSTNDSPDDNLTQNLISDIAFEYILKQTQTQTMLLKLFRHNGYESILEGEIVEMGAGFVYKRKIGDFKSFFRSGRRKRAKEAEEKLQTPQTPQPAE